MRKSGFALLELMIVVIIVGILASLAIPRFQRVVYVSRFAEVFQVVDVVTTAKHIWYAEHGFYNKDDGSGGRDSYGAAACRVGNGIDPSTSEVQQDLGIAISQNCFFQYFIAPGGIGDWTVIQFKELPNPYAWEYNYVTGQWIESAGHGGDKAYIYFRPPQ